MKIIIANKSHACYAEVICKNIEESAKVRGTGIARRTPEYIINKMEKGNAVIALDGDQFAGFCYIETWSHEKYVANSGLIVHPDYRKIGLAKDIKEVIFKHSREKYPNSKIFGITTGLAVMKINYDLGYQPVTFSELTDDESFWKGCQTCKNFDVLTRTEHKMCLCTGMLYDPAKKPVPKKEKKSSLNDKAFQRLKHIKQTLFYKKNKTEN
ncbi:GNAT family N-acetyltransferase [Christiangramia salexigens]|uniref:GNAT family N-acetyltransferase n=1 Tax=Christiangramia salexigens TaxID=1913577 RepID=A0A1L3J248_9FLAO|nr:GNAT family N-acetyltransferase [Christiangramia salexigens]APG59204.1 GNAT family N-acetyltransferase [Christiangramia salexigens]